MRVVVHAVMVVLPPVRVEPVVSEALTAVAVGLHLVLELFKLRFREVLPLARGLPLCLPLALLPLLQLRPLGRSRRACWQSSERDAPLHRGRAASGAGPRPVLEQLLQYRGRANV